MMRVLGCYIMLALCVPMIAQNLVPNGDFEQRRDSVPMPDSWLIGNENINDFIFDWYTPIGTTTDIHHTDSSDCWACMPNGGEGNIHPHSGSVCIGFINHSLGSGCSPRPWHEYVSTELMEPLTPGNLYCVEFWVALAGKSLFATNNIGALFTTGDMKRNDCEPVLRRPQVNHTEIIARQGEWVLISASFLADSAYTHITIGNFFEDSATKIITLNEEHLVQADESTEYVVPSGKSTYAYYYLDDISVILCQSARRED